MLLKSGKSHGGRALVAALAIGALTATVGCGTRDPNGVSAQALTTAPGQAGAPMLVSCEPHQRTLVRPIVVNGVTMSQIECVTTTDSTQQIVAPAPVQPVARQVRASQPVYSDLGDATIVSSPRTTAARPVQTRQEPVYRSEEPVSRTRSVKKSAIIIGSSAGVGAGVGAAVGGKKGALIGAAIGGGGAAIWDQITRRKE
jgi:uncharacterized Zn-binding protein involved in type VI secretion